MSVKNKCIDAEQAKSVIERMDEVPASNISAKEFIIKHFDEITLQVDTHGKDLKKLHAFFKSNGLDVGSYAYFSKTYSSVKKGRE